VILFRHWSTPAARLPIAAVRCELRIRGRCLTRRPTRASAGMLPSSPPDGGASTALMTTCRHRVDRLDRRGAATRLRSSGKADGHDDRGSPALAG
jgi:hypothetical protein